ncbi:MAG TPA: hypothetical protein V6C76_17570 [Drouetiella sp.]
MTQDFSELIGKKIVRATSSLKNFSIEFEGSHGLQMDAVDGPKISAAVVDNTALPVPTEAVCAVDWSWIYGSTLKSLKVDPSVARLQLDAAGPLTVTAGNWQNSAFLGFMPYKPAAK